MTIKKEGLRQYLGMRKPIQKHAVNIYFSALIFKVIKQKFWNIETKRALQSARFVGESIRFVTMAGTCVGPVKAKVTGSR
jgi:hypothetical protein